MAKKTKVTKKSTPKRRSASYNTHHEQNSFIIIAGGGLLVLVLITVVMFGMDSKHGETVTRTMTGQVENVTAAEEQTVTMEDMEFTPNVLRVKVGTTVTFTNNDDTFHNATSEDAGFDTGLLAKGESGSVEFSKAGTYTYHSTPNPEMTGTIIVEE